MNPLFGLLVVIFVLVIVWELFVAYKYVYLSIRAEFTEPPVKYTPQIRLDLATYERMQEWLKEKNEYQLPDYSLVQGERGRPNPFAQY